MMLSGLMLASVAAASGGCGANYPKTPPPVDQATFLATVASRPWWNSDEQEFLLRPDGAVECRGRSPNGFLWGNACPSAASAPCDLRWNLEVKPGVALVVHLQSPESSTTCTLTVGWFSDASTMDRLILSTPEGERFRFFSSKEWLR